MSTAQTTPDTIGIRTTGVHHLALRVTDLERAHRFYGQLLGFPVVLETDNLFLFLAGSTAFGVRGPEAATLATDRFDPFRVGLDHVALACESENELERVAERLDAAGVTNTGVKTDPVLDKQYVAFRDPDGIAWEFYMA
jgi:glyoxylase I family protein